MAEPESPSASSILRYLTQLSTSSEEFPQTLNAMLHSDDYSDFVSSLQGQQLNVFIDFLDRAIDVIPVDTDLYRKCLRSLRKICGQSRQLPTSHIISSGLVTTSDTAVAFGGFADIWMATYDRRLVAIKSLRIYGSDDIDVVKKRFCKEVVIWKRLSHPNVLTFLGVSSTISPLCMVSEWMHHGNIVQYLESHPKENRLELLLDIARGLEYLHSSHVVHGDLKGPNIVVDEFGHARLADFGLASIPSESISLNPSTPGNSQGTARWMAPELLDPQHPDPDMARPTTASDVYAFAMVVIEVFSGKLPFYDVRNEVAIFKMLNGERPKRPEGAVGLGLSDDVWQMVGRCWHEQPDKRPKVSDVVRDIVRAAAAFTSPSVVVVLPTVNIVDENQTHTTPMAGSEEPSKNGLNATLLNQTIQSPLHRSHPLSTNDSAPPYLISFTPVSHQSSLPSRTSSQNGSIAGSAPSLHQELIAPSLFASSRESIVAPSEQSSHSLYELTPVSRQRSAAPSRRSSRRQGSSSQQKSNPPSQPPSQQNLNDSARPPLPALSRQSAETPQHMPIPPSRKSSRHDLNPAFQRLSVNLSTPPLPCRQSSRHYLDPPQPSAPKQGHNSSPQYNPTSFSPELSRLELTPLSRQNSSPSQCQLTVHEQEPALRYTPSPPSRNPSHPSFQPPPVVPEPEFTQHIPTRQSSRRELTQRPMVSIPQTHPQIPSPPSRQSSRNELNVHSLGISNGLSQRLQIAPQHTPARQPSRHELNQRPLPTPQPEPMPQPFHSLPLSRQSSRHELNPSAPTKSNIPFQYLSPAPPNKSTSQISQCNPAPPSRQPSQQESNINSPCPSALPSQYEPKLSQQSSQYLRDKLSPPQNSSSHSHDPSNAGTSAEKAASQHPEVAGEESVTPRSFCCCVIM